MPQERFKMIGPLKVHFPDENALSFSIFEDCAELLGQDFQSEAYLLLKEKLKDVKPKPSMNYEADYMHITTANIETLIKTIEGIVELSIPEYQARFPKFDIDNLKKEFTNAKKNRPKSKEWATGDVFTITLKDNSYAFGQVLEKKHCTCALFNLRSKTNNLTISDFKKLKAVSILHLSNGDLLNNGEWKILFNQPVTLNPNSGNGGKFGDIGSISYGRCSAMTDLADVYWGLVPWNNLYEENYYDEMLLKNVSRPKSALILNSADRKRYREKKYGIDPKEESIFGKSTLHKRAWSWLIKLFGLELTKFSLEYRANYGHMKPFQKQSVTNTNLVELKTMEIIQGIICQVYAGDKSKKTIYSVLNEFIPGYEKINLDYASKIDDENYTFTSEEEMITYFIDTKGVCQTLYWNKYSDNPERIMVGANITRDDKLIISLTLNGTAATEEKYFRKLKNLLNSDIGVISYIDPADFKDGQDFILHYK